MSESVLLCMFALFFGVALLLALYPLKNVRILQLVIASIFLGVAGFGYWHWGSWESFRQQEQKKSRERQVDAVLKSISGPDELIAKLKERLQGQPKSAKGWYLLGRLYASQGAWEKAKAAFAIASELEPGSEKYRLNYAESMWQLNHQVFNDAIRAVFFSVLKSNPKQPDALAMLAMDAFLSKAYSQAIAYWERLLVLVPKDSEDALAIRKAIAKAQQRRA